MRLAVAPPLLPMLAKRVSALPQGGDWIFEPKWDGFRTLLFRDGDEVLLQSREARLIDVVDPSPHDFANHLRGKTGSAQSRNQARQIVH